MKKYVKILGVVLVIAIFIWAILATVDIVNYNKFEYVVMRGAKVYNKNPYVDGVEKYLLNGGEKIIVLDEIDNDRGIVIFAIINKCSIGYMKMDRYIKCEIFNENIKEIRRNEVE